MLGSLGKGPRVPQVACRYKIDDPEFLHLQALSAEGDKEFVDVAMLDFVPYAKYLPLQWLPRFKKALVIRDAFKEIRAHQIQEHRRTFVEGTRPSLHS